MKIVRLEHATLDTCVREAQHERVVITRDGKPVAFVVGVESWDREQIELSRDDAFWKLIAERRTQKMVGRKELEQKIEKGRR